MNINIQFNKNLAQEIVLQVYRFYINEEAPFVEELRHSINEPYKSIYAHVLLLCGRATTRTLDDGVRMIEWPSYNESPRILEMERGTTRVAPAHEALMWYRGCLVRP